MALPQNLSPLELLAERSRNMATKLQEPVKRTAIEQNTAQGNQPPGDTTTTDSDNQSTFKNLYNDFDHEESARIPRIARQPRHQSTASIGSILADFRLSTISIMDKALPEEPHNNAYQVYSDPAIKQPSMSPRTSSASHVEYQSAQTSRLIGVPRPVQQRSQSDTHAHREYIASRSSMNDTRRPAKYGGLGATPDAPFNFNTTSSMRSAIPQRGQAVPRSSSDMQSNGVYSDSLSRTFAPEPIEPVSRTKSYSGHAREKTSVVGTLLRGRSVSARKHETMADSRKTSVPPLTVNRDEDSFEMLKEKAMANTLTLEQHVSLGIYYHEKGNLRESSYHWQFAAFKGELTGMLLYGLALRHGWGIRQNAGEAVKWLRSAIGPAINTKSLDEVLDSELSQQIQNEINKQNSTSGAKKVNKAQIALALHELGMCHLKAWGTDKDEDMALRCFEVAGSMGDADALSEAAALWMRSGPKGRKKNLMRAAKLYRAAGERGASMVSNSWIYKDKYMRDDKKKAK